MPSAGDGSWPRGAVVLRRYGRQDQVSHVEVGTVISDDADGLALWVAAGSPTIRSMLADGRSLREAPLQERVRLPRVRRHGTWWGHGAVVLVPPGAEWSVWWFFEPDGSFRGWYGNLEAPNRRWETDDGLRGVDTADRALDVVIAPDRTCWWKDEDEFAAYTGQPGRWTAEQAPGIRAAGEHVMTLARAGAPPFDGRWTDFRPDPAWPLPTLPESWDHPHRAGP